VLLAAVVGIYSYFDWVAEQDLLEAMAEADQLDPGWRFTDLEAARAAVPDAENGAHVILATRALMPARWLIPTPGVPGLEQRLAELLPAERVRDADMDELRGELDKVAAARDKARELADRPRGRFRVTYSADLIGTLVPHADDTRNVVRLLTLDALLRCADGDCDGALRSCRAILNAGRALGDEPMPVSQFLRAGHGRDAVRAIERVLATGTATPRVLEDLQRLLQDEAAAPLLLTSARAERVCWFESLELMRTGRFNFAIYRMQPTMLGSTGDELIARGQAQMCQAPYLRHWNKVVEIAKLPPEVQDEKLNELVTPPQRLPRLIDGLMRGIGWATMARNLNRTQAELRCTAAALAAERYRLAEKAWPDRLDALVPRYLDAVPTDPFDGKPLRWRRTDDGLVIYSVGPDRVDNGGKLFRQQTLEPEVNIGFQLWDLDKRHLSARDP
jgi:hypothetical protein